MWIVFHLSTTYSPKVFQDLKINVTIEIAVTMASCELNNKIALLSEVAWCDWHIVRHRICRNCFQFHYMRNKKPKFGDADAVGIHSSSPCTMNISVVVFDFVFTLLSSSLSSFIMNVNCSISKTIRAHPNEFFFCSHKIAIKKAIQKITPPKQNKTKKT